MIGAMTTQEAGKTMSPHNMSEAFDETMLRCPACGSIHLHHNKVDVFERRHEDSAEGFHVAVDCDAASATVDKSIAGNPSERRGGISITFWCEQCEAISRLDLVQDKGRSLVSLSVSATL